MRSVCGMIYGYSLRHGRKETEGKVLNTQNNLQERDLFDSRWGFILASIGSAVGMGNIWRFPVMISKYGGLTFMIPYILFVILIGSTGIIEEMSFGRAAGSGPIGAFGLATEIRWGRRKPGETIGVIPVIGAMALAIGYTCVVGWIFRYVYLALTGGLAEMGSDLDLIGSSFGSTASSMGNNFWLVISIVSAFLIMAFGIAGGIEKANKVMMPALFGLFVVLMIYILTLPDAVDGYRYIFSFRADGLRNPEVWIYAFGQAFFSLSIAGNGAIIYGSYLNKKEDVVSSAANVAVFDTLAALLASFVIIPAVAVSHGELSSGGPGLMFINLVSVFNVMPGGRIVSVIFYICVLFAGISSLINLYEVPVAALQERLRWKRVPAVVTVGAIGCAVSLMIQGIVSPWMDVVSIYICPLGALLAGIMYFWVAGKDFALKSVDAGLKKPIGKWYFPLGRYVYCSLALIALIAGALLGGIG